MLKAGSGLALGVAGFLTILPWTTVVQEKFCRQALAVPAQSVLRRPIGSCSRPAVGTVMTVITEPCLHSASRTRLAVKSTRARWLRLQPG